MTILEKYSRKSPMVLHAPMQRQTFEESGCFEVGTYLKREMSTSDPAFHSHSSRTSPGPTPAVPGCPGEGAGEGTAEEETWPCQQRGDGCTYCGEGVLCGQCVCVCGGFGGQCQAGVYFLVPWDTKAKSCCGYGCCRMDLG